MRFLRWAKEELGFNRNTRYQQCYLNETNIKTGIYMSFIVMLLEAWMIWRYVHKRPGLSFTEYFDGETNYLIFFSAAIVLLIFSLRYGGYVKNRVVGPVIALSVIILDIASIGRVLYKNAAEMSGGELLLAVKYHLVLLLLTVLFVLYEKIFIAKGKKNDMYGQLLNVLFAVISLGFGIETSLYDVSKSRQILCFITMVIFAVCMLIWKPYISVILSGLVFIYFYQLWYPALYELDAANEGRVLEGDRINFFIFWIVIVMVSISIYQQRRHEAIKDENLIAANTELDRKSKEDDLTGIHNMYFFNQETEAMLRDPSVDFSKKIFLFMNVENFKTYNDQFGYQAGNEYLTALAHRICDAFPEDPVARQSDDHFVVFTDADKAPEKTELVRKMVSGGDSEVYLELKVGGFCPKSRETDPRVAIDCARYACSLTKNQYGQNYREYNEEVDSEFHKRQYIVNHIDRAVQNGYIKVFYQPVVWAGTKEVCGFEALARWDDPTYGFLSPGIFIPVLEEYRQIHKLDACIFEQVCKNMREGFDLGISVLPVSLNFSRLDFELMDAVGLLEELIERYDIPKDYLHVEITESALTENMEVLDEAMKRIKNDGIAMWLDDFGAGYSSFNVLKDFDFDVLKIDMTFLKGFEKNEKSPVILNTIIQLADELGMLSLTEGVETEEAADFLTEAGCGRLQGYLFGKPIPIEEVREKITSGAYRVSSKLI